MLTADLPFRADTTMEMLLAHTEQPRRPTRTLRTELHQSIASLTMRLLEKDLARRPANAEAPIEELEAANCASMLPAWRGKGYNLFLGGQE
jgi:hypothetical protein